MSGQVALLRDKKGFTKMMLVARFEPMIEIVEHEIHGVFSEQELTNHTTKTYRFFPKGKPENTQNYTIMEYFQE